MSPATLRDLEVGAILLVRILGAFGVSPEHDRVQRHHTLEEETSLRVAYGAQLSKFQDFFELIDTLEHGRVIGNRTLLRLREISELYDCSASE